MSEVKSGRKNVSDKDFAIAVAAASAAGGTLKDVATVLGLEVGSVSTRLSNWRKAVAKSGATVNIPSFTKNRGGRGKQLDMSVLSEIFG